jgi:hypothetical protein
VLMTADELLDHLMSCQELISYKQAYGKLIGPPPPAGSWRNVIHSPPVLDAAKQSGDRAVNGLRIQLDALIVTEADEEPSGGHFQGKGYSLTDWRTAFATWRLCKHP